MVNTFISTFYKSETKKRSVNAKSINNGAKYLKAAYKIYTLIKNLFVVNVFLFVPNRVSVINGRGNQLIVIAKNKTQKEDLEK